MPEIEYLVTIACPECRTEVLPDNDGSEGGQVRFRCCTCDYVSQDLADKVIWAHAAAILASQGLDYTRVLLPDPTPTAKRQGRP